MKYNKIVILLLVLLPKIRTILENLHVENVHMLMERIYILQLLDGILYMSVQFIDV